MIVLVGRDEVTVEQMLQLDAEEAHHLRVRRAEPGQHVGLRNGIGLVGAGILLEVAAKRALIRVTAVAHAPAPAPLELLVAAGDKDRFGWLAEKCSELGVSALAPIETDRTGGVGNRVAAGHVARLQRRAQEAIKQSGAAWATVVRPPCALSDVLDGGRENGDWLADAGGDWPPALAADAAVRVLVGPEGGLTGEERSQAVAAGWVPVRLADHVLRFETAALAGAVAAGIARGRAAHG